MSGESVGASREGLSPSVWSAEDGHARHPGWPGLAQQAGILREYAPVPGGQAADPVHHGGGNTGRGTPAYACRVPSELTVPCALQSNIKVRDMLESSTLKEKQNTRITFEELEDDMIGSGWGRAGAGLGGQRMWVDGWAGLCKGRGWVCSADQEGWRWRGCARGLVRGCGG